MRELALIATLSMAACSTVLPPSAEPPIRGEIPGHSCVADGLERFAGQQATAAVGAQVRRDSRARTLRWIPEGSAVTMDYRMDRVNVRLDSRNRIESVDCG